MEMYKKINENIRINYIRTALMEINSVGVVLTTRKEQWKYDILLIRIYG